PAVRTPNLDRLAREGARFRHAYSATPTCTPARACLLTGMNPWNHGMLGYSRVAGRYPVEMPRLLHAAGYFTMAAGKLHYSPQRNYHGYDLALLDESGRSESIDFRSDYRAWFYSQAPNLNPDAPGVGWNDYKGKAYVLPERLHPTRWTADVAVNFIDSWQRQQPFFLKVSFARPHSPYDPPQRWMDAYGSANIPAPAVGAWASRNEARNTDRDDLWRGRLAPGEIRTARQAYYGSVSFVDEQIGRILEALEKRGWLDNTLIVYTSDHGDMTGDHHLWRKSYAYEPSARVPMLMRGPGVPPGTVSGAPVELRDILPTFLDAAGAPIPRQIDGRSLRDAANGRPWREFIDLEHDICYAPENNWNALTDGKTKYIYHAFDGREQLFDLTSDPLERNEITSSARLRPWRERLIAHLAPRGDFYVRNGALATRPEGRKHSPNYPANAKAV
ncbi:MAG: arylsulfatase, partial [Bryobacteraceae bacterium]|nr:arylsulfatase [Bryobacteraceae bacterium]